MSSEGTSLEDIETGNVQHSADDAVMNAILSDMNGVEVQQQQHQQQPMYIPPPVQHEMPMYQSPPPPPPQLQQPQHQPQYFQQPDPFPSMASPSIYEPVNEMAAPQYQQNSGHTPSNATTELHNNLKKNSWSTLFDQLREPLVVGLLVCLFSLPALHTWLSKRMSWAYKVGGSLSWIGFLLQFLLVAGIFATYQQITVVMGNHQAARYLS